MKYCKVVVKRIFLLLHCRRVFQHLNSCFPNNLFQERDYRVLRGRVFHTIWIVIIHNQLKVKTLLVINILFSWAVIMHNHP
jgi:hypothetical protein